MSSNSKEVQLSAISIMLESVSCGHPSHVRFWFYVDGVPGSRMFKSFLQLAGMELKD